MKNELSHLSTEQILKSYAFPHRFYVRYAVYCAKYAMANVKAEDQDPRPLKALALAEAFGNGQAIDAKELEAAVDVTYATYTAYAAATYAAAYAAHAATHAATHSARAATYTAYATAHAAAHAATHAAACAAATHAARVATHAASTKELKDYLIDTISKEFNDLELMLMRS
jgi:hypothetical protein